MSYQLRRWPRVDGLSSLNRLRLTSHRRLSLLANSDKIRDGDPSTSDSRTINLQRQNRTITSWLLKGRTVLARRGHPSCRILQVQRDESNSATIAKSSNKM